jgi:hypothetical protein
MKPNVECISNGCKNRVFLKGFWEICIDCYAETPDYIPTAQVNFYHELKNRRKKDYEITNDS